MIGQKVSRLDWFGFKQRNSRGVVLRIAVLVILLALTLCALRLASLPNETLTATPNIVLFSVDDTVLPSSWLVAYQQTLLVSRAVNPNGCLPPITWFSTCCAHGRVTSDCAVARKAHQRGHELAVHTMSHSKAGEHFAYADWVREAGGQRRWLAHNCSIPEKDVLGFRAPYFRFSEVLGTALQDLGFAYDSSLTGRNAGQRGRPLSADLPWPFAYCSSAASTGSHCGNWSSLDLWEVPAYTLPGQGPGTGRRVDPSPASNMTVLLRLKADFESKWGSGVPVSVMVHEPYLADRDTRQPIIDFLRYASKQPNTWFLTYRQYIDWLQAPPGTPVADITAQFPCNKMRI